MTARKSGLGRGLGALLKDEPAAESKLPLSRLKPNRLQPRDTFDSPALEELAASIRAQGVVQPIVVTPRPDGDYTIVAGERRWRAARLAGLEEVPVFVRPVADDRQLLETALVENLQRSDLNPIEEAGAYQRLQEEFGLRQEEVAQRVGKSRAFISNSLRLLSLPAEIQGYLRTGELTAGQARPMVALESADDQVRLARQAVKRQWTAREVEKKARARRGSARSKVDADTQEAAEQLTRQLQTKVEIRRRGKGGTVLIAFHSEDELIRIHEALMRTGGQK